MSAHGAKQTIRPSDGLWVELSVLVIFAILGLKQRFLKRRATVLAAKKSLHEQTEARIVSAPMETAALDTREAVVKAKHPHYYKNVKHLETIDVYRILHLFNVTDPCIQHAVKKLLVAGGRGAGKDIKKDIKEAMDSLLRWQEMRDEDSAPEAAESIKQALTDLDT